MSHKLSHSYDTTGFGTGHIRIGDLNGDGRITLADALHAAKSIAGTI